MSQDETFAGKVVVVTGAASGIGRELARHLAGAGAWLFLADIEREPLIEVAGEIGARALPVDVADSRSVGALADAVAGLKGHCDLLVCNAGVASTGTIADMTQDDWDWLFGVNVWGFLNLYRAFGPLLGAAPGGGAIGLTSSMSAFHVTPGMGGYTASKFAVTAIAETIAAERPDLAMTILCPGPVDTRLGSAQRNRPAGGRSGLVDVDLAAGGGGGLHWADPTDVAAQFLAGIARRARYVFTHPEWRSHVEPRHAAIASAFAASADTD
ncbi:SDR family NAD(P)-dependent oxidoreductase [Tsuneonella sp. HG222]